MKTRLCNALCQLSVTLIVAGAAFGTATTATAAVVLPPSPCVQSALRCVLGELPHLPTLPVLHDPIVHCDASCGIRASRGRDRSAVLEPR